MTTRETRSDLRSNLTRDDVVVIRRVAGHYRIEDKATGQWIGSVMSMQGISRSKSRWTVFAGADAEDRYVPGFIRPRHTTTTDRLSSVASIIVQFARGYR